MCTWAPLGQWVRSEQHAIMPSRKEDAQHYDLQTDSPTSTRPGFRLQCQAAANLGYDVGHIDLKTACLQGEAFDAHRDVICQLPPEAGHPAYMGARLKGATTTHFIGLSGFRTPGSDQGRRAPPGYHLLTVAINALRNKVLTK